MEIVGSMLIIVIVYFIFSTLKFGNVKFWKAAKDNPDEAFLFINMDENFFVFSRKPDSGYRANLPEGDWVGPFKLHVPSCRQTFTIYGKSPGYVDSQKKFLKNVDVFKCQ